ncbi:hypothetical protein [Streptomyces scopuliridis]|uniref:Uncharacterized protein n=1 Tax=Streptomyces scopuliridis RB72 TaxID=1440053 RepID=A0A2T7SP42_9ACTN|nr:hypothetical protein [Streptomyces scopuliridis]PVE04660.1 hypothetical protein Y717_10720 [Streptomyces scopuliridis RB72]
MAAINPPAWMQAGSYPARTDRLVISALLGYPGFLVDEATPTRIRQGVKPSYQNQQLKVRPAPTPNMTVIVSAGFAFIDQHDAGGQGTYVCANDGDVNLTVDPAGGAGQFRRDCVVASVYDAETAGSVSEWRLEVIKGTYASTAGGATRPSLPPNAQILADVTLAPNQTSIATANVLDVRQFSVALGGIQPITASTDMNRPHPGQVRYRWDTDTFVYGRADGSTVNLLQSGGASLIGQEQYARKTVDTTLNTTTSTNDPHLTLPVAANAEYTLDGLLFVLGGDFAADIKISYAYPSGAQLHFTGPGPHPALTSGGSGDGEFVARQSPDGIATTIGYASSTSRLGIPLSGVLITGGTAGTFTLQWGVVNSGNAAITVRVPSYIALKRRA